MGLGREAIVAAINDSELPQEEKAELIVQVDRVVTMSEKDRRMVTCSAAAVLPNGVDLTHFRPADSAPDARRLLFIGSFAHRPNVMAVEFFVNEVFPRLREYLPVAPA